MRRKKTLLEIEVGSKIIFTDNVIRVSKEKNEWFFEIGKELTTDIGEAVAVLIRSCDNTNQIWNIEIGDINIEHITPKKSLFWLTGGDKEWRTMEYYNTPWCDCYLDFQTEFGLKIINIIKKSKTLGDIRDYYIEYLNLPILYDFALSKNLLKAY